MKISKNINLNKLLFREIKHNDIWRTFKKAIPKGFSSTRNKCNFVTNERNIKLA